MLIHRIWANTGLDPNQPVLLFTFSTLLYCQHAQTSLHRMKWVLFPLTSNFSPWSVTTWCTHSPYNRHISCPVDHQKETKSNSSTRKISQAVAHKSWVERCSPSTTGFSCNNFHNLYGFNHSHSQSSHH